MTIDQSRQTDHPYYGAFEPLVQLFQLPKEPPSLPVGPGEEQISFRPSPGFLSYLKLGFFVTMGVLDLFVLVVWLGLLIGVPVLGLLLTPTFALVAALNVVAYLALRLRYDNTWYVMTGRSLRIRRGIWVIHETTITFENIQNIKLVQGPLQRFFRIANLMVETAGGGTHMEGKQVVSSSHVGLIEGVEQPEAIRDLILARLRKFKTTGLGDDVDEMDDDHTTRLADAKHLSMLREIRDLARALPR